MIWSPSPFEEFESLATGRLESCFASVVKYHSDALFGGIQGKRIAVIGAAGSIGLSVVKSLLPFEPHALTLVDLSENNLVEVVRGLRSTLNLKLPDEFAALPIGLGSLEWNRYITDSLPFDYIINLSAIKHVRSEKDIYSLMRMVDTNVLFLHEFLEKLSYRPTRVFSVSSDKAVNPANLMGAGKRVMEKVLLYHSDRQSVSSARFANVAFSDGSLPFGFLQRMAKRQPLVAPKDIRRFFISHEEAGQICLLSAILGQNKEVFYPRLEARLHEKTFVNIALSLLERAGYEPYLCSTEQEALQKASELISRRKWPCCFTSSDTTGEKPYEEFTRACESPLPERFAGIGVIAMETDDAMKKEVDDFIQFIKEAKNRPRITKSDYIEAFQKIVPELRHDEREKSLDQKM